MLRGFKGAWRPKIQAQEEAKISFLHTLAKERSERANKASVALEAGVLALMVLWLYRFPFGKWKAGW